MSGEVKDGRVTEWLDPRRACGESGYGEDVRSNLHWCRAEARRLQSMGKPASVVFCDDGRCAVVVAVKTV